MGQQPAQDSGWGAGMSTELSPTRQAPPCAPVKLMALTNKGGIFCLPVPLTESAGRHLQGCDRLCVNLVQSASGGSG